MQILFGGVGCGGRHTYYLAQNKQGRANIILGHTLQALDGQHEREGEVVASYIVDLFGKRETLTLHTMHTFSLRVPKRISEECIRVVFSPSVHLPHHSSQARLRASLVMNSWLLKIQTHNLHLQLLSICSLLETHGE